MATTTCPACRSINHEGISRCMNCGSPMELPAVPIDVDLDDLPAPSPQPSGYGWNAMVQQAPKDRSATWSVAVALGLVAVLTFLTSTAMIVARAERRCHRGGRRAADGLVGGHRRLLALDADRGDLELQGGVGAADLLLRCDPGVLLRAVRAHDPPRATDPPDAGTIVRADRAVRWPWWQGDIPFKETVMKITVVGSGFVGQTTAMRILEKGLGDVVLIDIIEKAAGPGPRPEGSGPVGGTSPRSSARTTTPTPPAAASW